MKQRFFYLINMFYIDPCMNFFTNTLNIVRRIELMGYEF